MPPSPPDTNSSKTALERKRDYNRRWHLNNRDKALERMRRWNLDNLELKRERSRRWHLDNREKALELMRAGNLRRKYGINLVDFEALQQKQNGLCRICQKDKAACVDHCHKTGRVRGLLCHSCNKGLGHFKDDFSTLIRAANYIGWRSN